ncbi:hypothetical protein [Paraflavitalea speifideaquila]|uniref:hypothetical protein n=1 Tax=Paraflavitalea speifideaquila TaxID=3076558 RepID=UPI0028E91239|nr:hypothetical protein [Paraflavitalea speifideiaquila]
MEQKEYCPAGCEHKHDNDQSSWNWISETSGTGENFNFKVETGVCMLCGDIRLVGHRDGKRFDEVFNIHFPEAVEAIVKQCNWLNTGDGYIPFVRQTTDVLKELEGLRRWKSEMLEVWQPLLDWGYARKDITVGTNITKEIQRRLKHYDELTAQPFYSKDKILAAIREELTRSEMMGEDKGYYYTIAGIVGSALENYNQTP